MELVLRRRTALVRAAPAVIACACLVGTAAFATDGGAGAPVAGSGRPATKEEESMARRLLREQRAKVRACYDAALLGNPGLRGTLVFGWSVSKTGAVDGCVTSSDLSDESGRKLSAAQQDALWGCVSRVVHGLRFPPPEDGEKVEHSHPFVFAPVAPPLKPAE